MPPSAGRSAASRSDATGRRVVVLGSFGQLDGTVFGRESRQDTRDRARREVLMAVGMLLDAPEGSQAMYDELTEKIFGTLQPATTPEGLIIHSAG